MQITAKLIGTEWVVTVKSGNESVQWIHRELQQALKTAHAKLLNKLAAYRTLIVSVC